MMLKSSPVIRCPWPTTGDPLYLSYHNDEWGVPVKGSSLLSAHLNCMDGQAGGRSAFLPPTRSQSSINYIIDIL